MKTLFLFLLSFILLSQAFAQEAQTVGVVEIDLAKKCEEEMKNLSEVIEKLPKEEQCSMSVSSELDTLADHVGEILLPKSSETIQTCLALEELSGQKLEPIVIDLPGTEKPRKNMIVRFTMGLKTVPFKVNTNMEFVSANGTKINREMLMKYDTRWKHFNPKNWDSVEGATNLFHESTMSYQVDLLMEGKDKKRTGFTLFLDHPKWKGAVAEDAGGHSSVVPTVENTNFGDSSAYQTGSTIYHVQNSHMNLIGGLKVSRELWVKEFKNRGRLSYHVEAGAGANMGISRVVEAKVEDTADGGYWKSMVGKAKVQGFTGLVGHGIEYEKGKTAVALTHNFQYTQIKQDYLDGGYVKYALPHHAVSLSVSVNVFNRDRKRDRKEKKENQLQELE